MKSLNQILLESSKNRSGNHELTDPEIERLRKLEKRVKKRSTLLAARLGGGTGALYGGLRGGIPGAALGAAIGSGLGAGTHALNNLEGTLKTRALYGKTGHDNEKEKILSRLHHNDRLLG